MAYFEGTNQRKTGNLLKLRALIPLVCLRMSHDRLEHSYSFDLSSLLPSNVLPRMWYILKLRILNSPNTWMQSCLASNRKCRPFSLPCKLSWTHPLQYNASARIPFKSCFWHNPIAADKLSSAVLRYGLFATHLNKFQPDWLRRASTYENKKRLSSLTEKTNFF